MKRTLLTRELGVVLLLLSSISLRAQQYPQFALFSENLNIYNPASTGVSDYIQINAGARYQWIGLQGAPFAQSLNFQSPAYNWNSGVGFTIINNQQGLQRNTSAGINYAYIIRKKKNTISFGVRAGVIQSYLDGSGIITPQGVYEAGTINHNDPILPVSKASAYAPDLAMGFCWIRKTFYLGLSTLYATEPQLKLTTTNSPKLQRHYVAALGKKFNFTQKLSLNNNYLFKTDQSDFQAETNVLLNFKHTFSVGLGYRASSLQADALLALFSLSLSKKFLLSYAYEYPLTVMNKVTSGSQEILVTYRIGLNTTANPGKIIYNPRY